MNRTTSGIVLSEFVLSGDPLYYYSYCVESPSFKTLISYVNLKKPKYAVTDDMYCTKKLCKNCLEPKNTYDIMDSYAVVALKEKVRRKCVFFLRACI